MKRIIFFFIGCYFLVNNNIIAQKFDYKQLNNSHSLSMPNWGPYMKLYNGITHLPLLQSGMQFEFSIHPGYYLKRNSFPANTYYESGYHFWEASPDLSYYAVRYELEWKDRVYCNVAFYKVDEKSYAIRYELVNNTDLTQDISIQNFANINYPSKRPYSLTPLYSAEVNLPDKSMWVNATEYSKLSYGETFPQLNLVFDGHQLGVTTLDNAVDGSVLGSNSKWRGKKFGEHLKDRVIYPFSITSGKTKALLFRYILEEGKESHLRVQSEKTDTIVKLFGTGDFDTFVVPLIKYGTGNYTVEISIKKTSSILIDGFAIAPYQEINNVSFNVKTPDYTPQLDILSENSFSLSYKDIDGKYFISTINAPFVLRNFIMDKVDDILRESINANKYNDEFYNKKTFQKQGDVCRTNVFMKQLGIAPGSEKVFYTLLQYQQKESEPVVKLNEQQLESLFMERRKSAILQKYNKEGDKYSFSQQLMAATLLTNVVYPVYTYGTYILHNTPGRIWDCLYTWDNGFIALGLADLDIRRSLECVNAYTMKENDQSAFLHHGTPLPVQIFLIKELWEKSQDKEMLAYLYPRLKRFYLFLAGNYRSSTTRKFNSNMLCTWDYFYNSGGWDDYPPQVYVHKNKLEWSVAPIINTAHAIRTAKILLQAAEELDIPDDIKLYEKDIELFSEAIQQNAWDNSSGYYGYVVHDENKNATGILKDSNGINMNMGLDGCYPLFSGICTQEQQDSIIKRLFTPGKIWSPIGLSTVDQSAPNYLKSGYWNGSVWMPHQWFFFKTMLDLGYSDRALQIAKTGLDIWKQETESTYNCYEVFRIETGRGAGWHQFGGLSAPVINWFSSLYKPGTVTTGFDVWVENKKFNDDFSNVRLKTNNRYCNKGNYVIWICMNDKYSYKITDGNNLKIELQEVFSGLLAITVDNSINQLDITIEANPD